MTDTRRGVTYAVGMTARAVVGSLLVFGLVVVGCGDDAEVPGSKSLPVLSALHAERGARAGIYDAEGRQVLLRGVNLNSLGDYYQDNPNLPTVIPVAEEDFREMASLGLNVVRLVLSWSLLQPERGTIDTRYFARIRQVIQWASAAGLYTILDMHQDAWGKAIASPPGTVCAGEREPAIGWDGAPTWATYTDGRSTCRQRGVRELAPAVSAAFENFYANREGIQDEWIRAWAALAAEFAREPAVAGYDLFNEPHFGASLFGGAQKLAALYGRVIPALRQAERQAGGFAHIVFFEPVILWPFGDAVPPPDFVTDDNMVFAPHNYAESITGFNTATIEATFAQAAADAGRYGTTFWIGEFGWFSDPPANQPRLLRYAAEEDRWRVGGAWWQWKQACGDPHSIGLPGGQPPSVLIHLHRTGCPGDHNLGLVREWVEVLSRPYVRAAPGRLTAMTSDARSARLEFRGETPTPGLADLWVPARGSAIPQVRGTLGAEPCVTPVRGGFRVFVPVQGSYEVSVHFP